MNKPYAQPTGHVCGVCGVDWKKHEQALAKGQKVPTLETCILVLREELRVARSGRSNAAYQTLPLTNITAADGTWRWFS